MGRGKLRSIKQRIDSTRSTQHITHAMEMVATAKVNKVFKSWHSFNDYVEKVDEIVGDCISGLAEQNHPLIEDGSKKHRKTAVILISSDMGLAGAYNLDLFREAESYEKKLGDDFAGFLAVGSKGLGFCKYRKKKILFGEEKFYDMPDYSVAEMLVNRVMAIYKQGKAECFKVLYSKYFGKMAQRPKVYDLLPIVPNPKDESVNYRVEYEFEPEPSKILESVIPLYLSSHLLHLLLEAKVSELYSRQNAMRNATENAENLIQRFTLEYNKARQASITQEIIEIVNGAEALKE